MHFQQPIPQDIAYQAEIEIKKSRFIGLVKAIEKREDGMIWLEQVKKHYPDARHHCWAYVIGDPHCASSAGAGDDGEPSGTAGKPILNVLTHKNIGNIMLIVVRYFGGIKLGAGGLTRAYGQAAQAVIDVTPLHSHIPQIRIQIECPFELEQKIRHLISLEQGQILDVSYSHHVRVTAQLPTEGLATLKAAIAPFGMTLKA